MQVSRSSRLTPFALLCAYAAAALYELPLVRYQINPDGIAYIHAARRWAAGNFFGAINGCYSPLFSWLLVPFIAAGVDALLASKIITFAAGGLTVAIVWKLTAHFSERLLLRAIATIAAGAMLLGWAASLVTPDVIVVMTACAWLFFLIEDPTTRSAVAAGIAGGLMYLAKSYGFPFVVASLVVVTALKWFFVKSAAAFQAAGAASSSRSDRTRDLLRSSAITAAVFLVIAIPWAVAVSIKYGKPTIGTAAAYNVGLIGPLNGPVGSRNHPIGTAGFMPPSDPQAFSASDDLTYHPFPPWPGGRENVKRLWQNFAFNLSELWDNIGGPAFLTAIAAFLSFAILGARRRTVALTLATAAVYLSGYLLLILDQRYLWCIPMMLLLVAVAVIDAAAERLKVRSVIAAFVTALVVSSFAWPAVAKLSELRYIDIELTDDVRLLRMRGIELRGHRVASLNGWDPSMYLLYHVDAIYFGVPKPDEPDEEIRADLDRFAIDTVLVWYDEAMEDQPALSGWKKVITIDEGPVAVYQR